MSLFWYLEQIPMEDFFDCSEQDAVRIAVRRWLINLQLIGWNDNSLRQKLEEKYVKQSKGWLQLVENNGEEWLYYSWCLSFRERLSNTSRYGGYEPEE